MTATATATPTPTETIAPSDLPNNLRWHVDTAETALRTFEQGKRVLHTGDGRRIYADEEHERRMAALRPPLEAAITSAGEATNAAVREAEQALDTLEVNDPIAALRGDDLQRAAALGPFVKEDATDLPIGDVIGRVRAIAAGDDKVLAALYWRYGMRRLGQLQAEGGASNTQDGRALAAVLTQLQALVGPSGQKRAAAERALRLAKFAAQRVRTAAFEAQGGQAAIEARLRASGMYSQF